MLPLLLAVILTQAPKETWYGPAEIRFPLQVTGNPYDPDQNDVQVTFTNGDITETRFAYFDGAAWRCRLLTQKPGDYQAAITLNGKPVTGVGPTQAHATSKREMPFVRLADNRFVLTDGKPYWPIGHSLGVPDPKLYPMLADQLPTMGANGVNWTRIWATYWDGRNPYWVAGAKLPDGYYSQ